MANWQVISGGVTAPKGYKAAGITAGLKPSGAPDLALIYSEVEAIAAGIFTTSQVRAACVDYCRDRLQAKPSARAILVNAGQANAATGAAGAADAEECAQLLAKELDIDPNTVLLASTGVIGQRIKMEPMRAGIPQVVAALSDEGGASAEKSILTTDLVTKSIALETMIGDRPVRIGGMSKGSGMIHPNMATMLAFVTCDAAVSPQLWQEMLSRAGDRSFNQITVDGDTSTNDSLFALANGQSRTPAITQWGPEAEKLEAMLTAVCTHLAKAIARDGEGATCLIEVAVSGAPDEAAARAVAKTIAGSALTKSAIFGRDPNWGRIAGAAGRAGVKFDQNNLRIQLGEIVLMENGQPLAFDRMAAHNYLKAAAEGEYLKTDTVAIGVSIGDGPGSAKAWGCDLSYDYVKINAEYTT
ncbi:bifunctional ornithine acetyltransferase/N-acetylglutamate synthase [Limnothrix sp. FACHB-708]|uniref:bifunctional ornithine acetyltransferase/N-acetylglutamate synthase n=1 Tax=unclassified Limnothrix TaxID=2632864 RepID=UPI001689D704|nr:MULTISPECIES: bifunctional ornithine acetyltransferase/N-acetylglutamate synthase [unclassified Limnothrix]MBD2552917.1 bifunctional ornithine acetyltransferase/N-acetylglutamate synthase [Limnothrix sp. FACHB-708]MBD2589271.1 bifunctional ornithine acetyltransferase/N-acetylglutamate synthase [Limnothrix sp. FACHB-406]